MRILLDECIDQRLRLLFVGHACETAGYAKLAGLKNGALLDAAEGAGFEVLVTTDQAIPHQQNLTTRQISILILCGSGVMPAGTASTSTPRTSSRLARARGSSGSAGTS
jgi:hypothetical protein